jgi:hypothetical protein
MMTRTAKNRLETIEPWLTIAWLKLKRIAKTEQRKKKITEIKTKIEYELGFS